jgi:hypothetical protein
MIYVTEELATRQVSQKYLTILSAVPLHIWWKN